MFFILCVLFAAILIEGIGTYVSVVGLSALFSANAVIIALAISLDVGKVVTVSFLYHNWGRLNVVLRSYMLLAAAILMTITSAGAFGFLSTQFQRAMSNTNQHGVMLTSLTQEQDRLQQRKREIDSQIAALPANVVRGRTQLMRQFAPEVERINARLVEIDMQLPALKIESIKKNVEVGPIMYVAEVFDVSPERAAKWIIFTIIFVFDPLAIVLLLAANFLIQERSLRELEKRDQDENRRGSSSSAAQLVSAATAASAATTGITTSITTAPGDTCLPTELTSTSGLVVPQSAAISGSSSSSESPAHAAADHSAQHDRGSTTTDGATHPHSKPAHVGADRAGQVDLRVQSADPDIVQHSSLARSALAQPLAQQDTVGLEPVQSTLSAVSSHADVEISAADNQSSTILRNLYRSH